MATLSPSGDSIRLEASDALSRREEWSPWKSKGYRVLDRDGVTVWHEKEAIRRRVLEVFEDCDADLFLFGSQATGQTNRISDYDVGYFTEEPPPASRLAQLKEDFEEWPIPSEVELVDFHCVPKEFAAVALKQVKIWKQKKRNSLFTSKP